jgi:hypothetical protein
MAKDIKNKGAEVTFRFGLHGDSGAEDFLARTDNVAVIGQARDQLAKPEAERRLIITGPIQKVPPGSHLNWSWQHLDSAWEFTELSMELCDANPSYVESNLDQWLDQVGRLCPWSSYVKYEVKEV